VVFREEGIERRKVMFMSGGHESAEMVVLNVAVVRWRDSARATSWAW
jgi:hypothetical protein